MSSKLQYKGYTGYFDYSKDDDAFCGTIEHIPDSLIIYSGKTISEIIDSFREMVDGEIEDGEHINNESYDPKAPLSVTLYDQEIVANALKVEKTMIKEAS